MKHSTIILLILFLTSCSGEKARLDLLDSELRLKLPKNFETIVNSTEGLNDYEINVDLKFDKKGIQELKNQIEKSKYIEWSNIDVLSKYPEKETIVKQDTTINGIWKNCVNGYRFEYYGDSSEPISAKIDTIKQTIEFNFVNL